MNTATAHPPCAAVRRRLGLVLGAAFLGGALVPGAHADGELALRVDGPRVRLSYTLPLEPGTQLGVDRVRLRLGGLSLYDSQRSRWERPALSEWSATGDWRATDGLGWRATGGVLRGEALAATALAPAAAFGAAGDGAASLLLLDHRSIAVPYLGLGYSARPGGRSWAWHADLGLVMLKPRSAVRLGASGGSPLTYDTASRDGDVRLPAGLGDWRVSPVMQLGVSYAF